MRNTAVGIALLSTIVLACKGLVLEDTHEGSEGGYQLQRVRHAPQSWWGWPDGDGTDSSVTSTAPVSAQIMSTSSTPPSAPTKRPRRKNKSKNSYATKKVSTTAKLYSSVEPNEVDAESYLSHVSLDSDRSSLELTASVPTPVPISPIAPSSILLSSRPFIPASPKPLSAQYTEFQQKKISLFESLLDFNKFEVAYVSLQELQKIITPLLNKLATLLGDECRSEWPHLSFYSTPLRTCSHIRHVVNAELSSVEEWVLRNKNFRDSIQTLSRDAQSMHQIYKDALQRSLDGSHTVYSTVTLSDYPKNALGSSPPRVGFEFGPAPKSLYDEIPRTTAAPFINNIALTFSDKDRMTESSSLAVRAVEFPELSSSSVSPTDISTEQVNTTLEHNVRRFPKSTSTEQSVDIMEVSLRSFFGLPDDTEGTGSIMETHVAPNISKYINDINSVEAVEIARRFLNNTLQEGFSGNPEIFFFATNLYTASPKLYDALKNDMPSIVETVVSKHKYRLQMNQNNNKTYALLVNSTTGMKSVETFGRDGETVIGSYWKFLPRRHGDLFILFNVDTKTIIGAGQGWEANGLTFKDESDIIIEPFLDPSALNVSDNFLWNLYLECDTEVQNNVIDSSEYEQCPPGHVYLEVRNEEFHNLKLTLDADGNPALRSACTSWRLEAIE